MLPLSGGALLLLSNTRYSTPSHAPIDKVQSWSETESSLHSNQLEESALSRAVARLPINKMLIKVL